MSLPLIAIVGWHNTGKTGLIVRLVATLTRRGYRVAAIKHTAGHVNLDREGSDTWRFAQAGADVVAVSGGQSVAYHERVAQEPSLEDLLTRLPQDLDLVIAEGFKREPTLKIEILRADRDEPRIAPPDQLLALVSDGELEGKAVPCFKPDDTEGLLGLLLERGILSHREVD